jgi:hypothetical protein
MESTPSINYTELSNSLGATRFKPETKGEWIEITVTSVKEVSTKDGKSGICVEGFERDGSTRDWVAWNRRNKEELLREQPQLFDILRIEYKGTDPAASGPLAAKWFTLKVVERGEADDGDIDFGDSAA